jgi:hypothetical protein
LSAERKLSDTDVDLFNELWAGAYFDIISAVIDKWPDWDAKDQAAMIHMVVQALAVRAGVVEDDDDASEISEDQGAR